MPAIHRKSLTLSQWLFSTALPPSKRVANEWTNPVRKILQNHVLFQFVPTPTEWGRVVETWDAWLRRSVYATSHMGKGQNLISSSFDHWAWVEAIWETKLKPKRSTFTRRSIVATGHRLVIRRANITLLRTATRGDFWLSELLVKYLSCSPVERKVTCPREMWFFCKRNASKWMLNFCRLNSNSMATCCRR